MKNHNPTISVVIPTFNEEKNIEACLSSIFRQNFPKEKLEVIVVDDKSTDNTIEITKNYPVKIFISGSHHGEISKMIGFKKATGEFVMYLDADNELVGDSWFQKILKPFLDDEGIVGSFTWEGSRSSAPGLERFLSFDPLQRDSLYQFFSPSIHDVLKQKKEEYWVLDYSMGKIPPAGRCMYRKQQVSKYFEPFEMYLELDFLTILVRNGFTKFAYVPKAGLYHHHASSIGMLVRKRLYNLNNVYLGRKERLYKWFDLTNPQDFIKIVLWIVYVTLIFPSVIIGLYKIMKYKDWAGLFEPIVNLFVTYAILFSFITTKKGWNLLLPRKS